MISIEQEIWKEIPGYEGRYEASTFGFIRNFKTKKIKSTYLNEKDYLVVDLIDVNGIKKHRKVHRLVALTFIPNPDNKPDVNHLKGNKLNNEVSNIEWSTREENLEHAQTVLSSPSKRKLTQEDINYILDNPSSTKTDLCKKFEVDPKTIYNIRMGFSYRPFMKVYYEINNSR